MNQFEDVHEFQVHYQRTYIQDSNYTTATNNFNILVWMAQSKK